MAMASLNLGLLPSSRLASPASSSSASSSGSKRNGRLAVMHRGWRLVSTRQDHFLLLGQCNLSGSRLKECKPQGHCRVVCENASSSSLDLQACPGRSQARNIWLSDVVVTRPRPSLLNRQWSGKDVAYVSFMAFMHGLCFVAPFTFSWGALGASVVLYVITGMLGITLSFHRNLSHKSFKLPKWLEYTFAYCGVQALQGDPLEWVSSHRYHHQHCDTELDPHSPLEGFWYSHMGWLFDHKFTDEKVGERSNINDLAGDPFYQFIARTYAIHPVLLAVLLYGIGGIPYVVWGMAVRTVWVYHITWAVNSAAHVWGTQQWNTGDLSRNNWWVALLAFGEGWHNNHHAFEYSARHGLDWWQLDLTWYFIRFLQALGLATKVRLPSREHKLKLA